jgi:hypothetical protein
LGTAERDSAGQPKTDLSDLRALILETLKSGNRSDLAAIADDVDSRLTDRQRLGYFRYFLGRYVQDVNRGMRAVSPPKLMQGEVAPADPGPATFVGPSGKRYASRRVASVRSWWQERLAGIWKVDGHDMFLRDLTPDHCRLVAEANRVEAARNLAVSARFAALADAVAEAGVGTVGELDEDTGRRCWDVAA